MGSLYGDLLCKVVLPAADIGTRQKVMQLYNFYASTQWWDIGRLIDNQATALSRTVRVAHRDVPFYRDLYDMAGVRVRDVKTVENLNYLPIVTKEMLRKAYPDRCTRKTRWPLHEYFTSGSSGEPFAMRVDSYSMSHARALMLLRATFSGWSPGVPFLQTGMSLNRGAVRKIKDLLLRVEYVSAFDLSDHALDRYLELIEKRKLRYVMGYAGSLYLLAERAGKRGFNEKMMGIVSWGDNLYAHYRRTIENQFSCTVTDTYGCGEGIQVAAQCGMNNGGYHIFMPHVVVEVVDGEGNPVKPGEMGHIVLTRLDPGAMPLIRYRVGDIGRKLPLAACACGRGLEMLAGIDGRDSDVIVTPGGKRLIVHFFTGIFEYYQSVESFRIVQTEPGTIVVELVPRHDFTRDVWQSIEREIREKGDKELKIQLELVSEIPTGPSKKRRFVEVRCVQK
jgi:phenylacetate-CoA ligase